MGGLSGTYECEYSTTEDGMWAAAGTAESWFGTRSWCVGKDKTGPMCFTYTADDCLLASVAGLLPSRSTEPATLQLATYPFVVYKRLDVLAQ